MFNGPDSGCRRLDQFVAARPQDLDAAVLRPAGLVAVVGHRPAQPNRSHAWRHAAAGHSRARCGRGRARAGSLIASLPVLSVWPTMRTRMFGSSPARTGRAPAHLGLDRRRPTSKGASLGTLTFSSFCAVRRRRCRCLGGLLHGGALVHALDHRLPATAPTAPPTTAPVLALPPVAELSLPTTAPMAAPVAVPFWRRPSRWRSRRSGGGGQSGDGGGAKRSVHPCCSPSGLTQVDGAAGLRPAATRGVPRRLRAYPPQYQHLVQPDRRGPGRTAAAGAYRPAGSWSAMCRSRRCGRLPSPRCGRRVARWRGGARSPAWCGSFIADSSAACTMRSLSASSALVASSSSSSGGFFSIARRSRCAGAVRPTGARRARPGRWRSPRAAR